jgi:hypothetical protein
MDTRVVFKMPDMELRRLLLLSSNMISPATHNTPSIPSPMDRYMYEDMGAVAVDSTVVSSVPNRVPFK